MTIDGNYDGKITIQKGQGISQAIRDELGLTQEECNKLGGSIWTKIFQQVETQNKQGQIYKGGSDLKGPTNKNFIVHPDQVIEFSKEIWNNIVQLVNDKLGKNIEKLESAPEVDPNPPSKDLNPPSKDQNPPASDLNPPKTGDEALKREGCFSCVSSGDLKKYTIRVADTDSKITKDITYNSDGSVSKYDVIEYNTDGNLIKWTRYNSDGSVESYSRNEYDDKGNDTKNIYYKPDGSVKFYVINEHDTEGNLIKCTRYNPDGTIDND